MKKILAWYESQPRNVAEFALKVVLAPFLAAACLVGFIAVGLFILIYQPIGWAAEALGVK